MAVEGERPKHDQPKFTEKERAEELARLMEFYQILLDILKKLQGPIKNEYAKIVKSQETLNKYPTSMSNFRDVRTKRANINALLQNLRIPEILKQYNSATFPNFTSFLANRGTRIKEILYLEPFEISPATHTKKTSFNLPEYLARVSRTVSVISNYLRTAGMIKPEINRKTSKTQLNLKQSIQQELDLTEEADPDGKIE